MFNERKSPLRQMWRQFGGALLGMLNPKGAECRFCRNVFRKSTSTRSGSGLGSGLGLCRECEDSIPWIQDVLCPVCGRYEDCYDCARREETYFVRNRSAVRYDERMKDWLARYKYRGDERLAGLMADVVLHAYRLHELAEKTASQSHRRDKHSKEEEAAQIRLLTYVPLSEARWLDRGFNQAEQMAIELGKRLGLPVIPLLQRNRHTEKQSLKTRGARLRDMRGLFSIDEAGVKQLESLIRTEAAVTLQIHIVDDVYTTGSTLNECAKAITTGIDEIKQTHVNETVNVNTNVHVYGLTFAR